MMTANKVYNPAYIGGKILGVQLTIQNPTVSDVSCEYTNGVYYSFDGRDYQLLSLGGETVEAGHTVIKSKEFREYFIPTSDIKIMIDTGGMVGCIVNCEVVWGV